MAEITWLGHASFRIEGSKRIYIDPWKLSGGPPADLILVSHEHFDHFSREDIQRVRGPETTIVTVPGVASQLSGRVRSVSPGDTVEVEGVTIEAVPAYNTDKPNHPREKGWVGFVVTLDGERIYFAGDTDHIPEMAHIKADVAILPVSGVYVMDAEQAAEAANQIGAGLSIPCHFGEIVGSRADAERFKELVEGEVRILEPVPGT